MYEKGGIVYEKCWNFAGEMEWYSGCQVLGFPCSDADARLLYGTHMAHEKLDLNQRPESPGSPGSPGFLGTGCKRPMSFVS